jgi:hypothetical protein
MKGTAKNIPHPAPSERGTKTLAFPLTLLIMDVRVADFSSTWMASGLPVIHD